MARETNPLQRASTLEKWLKKLEAERKAALAKPEEFINHHFARRAGRSKRDAGPEARALLKIKENDPDILLVSDTAGNGGSSDAETTAGADAE